MAWPILKVVIPEVLETAFVVVRNALEECGLKLENPDNSRITTWGVDGEQKIVPIGDVSSEVMGGGVINIQFWCTAEDDVFVAWKEESRGCLFSIYLNGVECDVAVRIVSKLAGIVLLNYRLTYGDGEALAVTFE
ncbi:hypothetical protein [Achromobacter spanius]|uniref:hypothetical protein n=1 Tax=Achromobacter spanius TaxID=217203 RepID=UPI00380D1D9E